MRMGTPKIQNCPHEDRTAEAVARARTPALFRWGTEGAGATHGLLARDNRAHFLWNVTAAK